MSDKSELQVLSRSIMINMLRLYFEIGFMSNNKEEIDVNIVRKANEMFMELEDESIKNDRLLLMYMEVLCKMDSFERITKFCELPIHFIDDGLGRNMGDEPFSDR